MLRAKFKEDDDEDDDKQQVIWEVGGSSHWDMQVEGTRARRWPRDQTLHRHGSEDQADPATPVCLLWKWHCGNRVSCYSRRALVEPGPVCRETDWCHFEPGGPGPLEISTWPSRTSRKMTYETLVVDPIQSAVQTFKLTVGLGFHFMMRMWVGTAHL